MNPDDYKGQSRAEVLAARAGFVRGVDVATHSRRGPLSLMEAEAEARIRYPLPKITRPRVVRDGCFRFKVVDDSVLACSDFYKQSDDWRAGLWEDMGVSTSILRDLLNNPTEEVEDDGSGEPCR